MAHIGYNLIFTVTIGRRIDCISHVPVGVESGGFEKTLRIILEASIFIVNCATERLSPA